MYLCGIVLRGSCTDPLRTPAIRRSGRLRFDYSHADLMAGDFDFILGERRGEMIGKTEDPQSFGIHTVEVRGARSGRVIQDRRRDGLLAMARGSDPPRIRTFQGLLCASRGISGDAWGTTPWNSRPSSMWAAPLHQSRSPRGCKC